jgi:myo-inositol-1(or 4)-monophosphatase
MTSNFNLPVDLAAVKQAVTEAGRIVASYYAQKLDVIRKNDGSPLTCADTECNQFLKSQLGTLLPSAGWLSEECQDNADRLQKDWVWVIDPIDGTKEFIRKIPELAISIGLVYRGQPVLGAVHNPITGEGGLGGVGCPPLFYGFSKPAVPASGLHDARVSVSRSEVEDGSITATIPWFGTVQPVGSVAYKLLRVAAGIDDLTFSLAPKSEWDICGGVALVSASGKSYQRFDSLPLRFNQPDPRVRTGAAAGDGALVTALIQRLKQLPDADHGNLSKTQTK